MLTPVGRQTVTQVRYSSGKLKELGIRLKSIRNIEKITKTMKMISSAKFAKVFFLSLKNCDHGKIDINIFKESSKVSRNEVCQQLTPRFPSL